ncbi:CRP-like cAMP-binding protein [Bradyrhizobium japonicum USDA 38]|jgi:CRP-like cAMP-binding protein|uniref:Crp/Fnr family transcriptional regulator n=1 Tax=Bradyrhizobium japonicum TaxID=375 RepID=UPI000488D583|nr:Crp/Fnr family transcriptional regulator [Bradyrhizobium japonicum]MCS3893347.1 CRP-like cAMP-binding protein [Bradyrhizobium japonicum USDA 38]MCS3945861.1 CRP-like cAMP-binding protein [Bradyrhizobium japonicum]
MTNLATALVTKLKISNDLGDDDLRAIEALPIRRRDLESQQRIVADGDRPTDCCLLFSGFAYRAKTIVDGRRQLLSLHVPGEIPDMQSLHLHVMDHDLVAMSPCVIGLISHDAIKALGRARPVVADAFWRETLVDAAIFREWIANLGGRPANSRLAHLLMEIYRRLEAIGQARNDEFVFPITQADLGDCLGLSAVHVNRVLQELRREGLVEVQRGRFRILQRKKLEAFGGFEDGYLHLKPTS